MNEDPSPVPHSDGGDDERRYDVFISAATSECGKARDSAAAELRKLDFHVAVQSDFEQRPASVTTLQKLHDYIRGCDEVHCVIGARSGAFPPPEAAAPFADLFPTGIAEASYMQWEYFFASRSRPDRLWLYFTTDAWRPDEAVPSEPDRPDSQRAFLALLRGTGQDYAEVATIGDVRAAVLARHARHRDVDESHGASPHDPFRHPVVANALGGVISGVLVALLIWAGSKLGGEVNPAFAALVLLASGIGGLAFFVIYQRYAAILTRRGQHERAAYDRLRRQLAAGGLAAETYVRRLRAALDAVDRFFGDAALVGRTLFPRAFGLRTPAPLWTASAFDRCLLLALVYPIATIFVVWAVSGHVGPAERSMFLGADVPDPRRAGAVVAVVAAVFAGWATARLNTRSRFRWIIGAIAVAGIGAFAGNGAFLGNYLGYKALAVPSAAAIVGVSTGYAAAGLVKGASLVSGIVAGVGVIVVGIGHGVGSAVLLTAFASVEHVATRAIRCGWQGPFLSGLVAILTLACFASASRAETQEWIANSYLLFYLGLLTLLNAPFDWVSLGLTRALLRRGLELGGWFPYLLALVDALAAVGVIALLTVVTVLGVQMFDDLAAFSGGDGAVTLPLDALFNGIQANPAAPEFWWVYAMLLSTMIPSLVNLTIAGGSLLRGVPWITALLLRNMPETSAPPVFERLWITLLLTAQLFIGGLLGIAAQGFLAYVVIGLVLPLFGLDLLDLARFVAAPDLPGALMRLVGTVRH